MWYYCLRDGTFFVTQRFSLVVVFADESLLLDTFCFFSSSSPYLRLVLRFSILGHRLDWSTDYLVDQPVAQCLLPDLHCDRFGSQCLQLGWSPDLHCGRFGSQCILLDQLIKVVTVLVRDVFCLIEQLICISWLGRVCHFYLLVLTLYMRVSVVRRPVSLGRFRWIINKIV